MIRNTPAQRSKSGIARRSLDGAHDVDPQLWHLRTGDELARAVFDRVAQLARQRTARNSRMLRWASLYENRLVTGWSADGSSRGRSFGPDAPTLNVVRSCVDTLTNRIARDRPRVQFVPSGGDWDVQQRAESLSSYLDGVFEASDAYAAGVRCFRDAAVFGTGALQVSCASGRDRDGGVRIDRVPLHEVYVDEEDGRYGRPLEILRLSRRSVAELVGLYPDHATRIRQAVGTPADSGDTDAHDATRTSTSSTGPTVATVEAWRLPVGDDPGKHVLAVMGCVLVEEDWDRPRHAIQFFHLDDPLVGFWGHGLAEDLDRIQVEINRCLRDIGTAISRQATPYVFVDPATNLNASHLNGTIGGIIKTPRPPTFVAPQAISPQVTDHVRWLEQKAYNITGISQLSAQGKKPAGLDSGVALREVQDIESERFVTVAQRYQRLFVEVGKVVIDETRALEAREPGVQVRAVLSSWAETLKWEDVDLDDDRFVMQAWPVSQLPRTPAGRLQFVQELQRAQIIGRETALSLFDMPDVKEAMSLETSSLDSIRSALSFMLKRGAYIPPTKYMDLSLAMKLAQQTLLRGMAHDMPDDVQELLRVFLSDCEALLEQAQPAAPETMPQTMPAGAPTPDVVSTIPASV